MKCSEGLNNRVSNVVRRYIDHMTFAAYMAFSFYHILTYSFGSMFYHCIYTVVCFVCFCLIL